MIGKVFRVKAGQLFRFFWKVPFFFFFFLFFFSLSSTRKLPQNSCGIPDYVSKTRHPITNRKTPKLRIFLSFLFSFFFFLFSFLFFFGRAFLFPTLEKKSMVSSQKENKLFFSILPSFEPHASRSPPFLNLFSPLTQHPTHCDTGGRVRGVGDIFMTSISSSSSSFSLLKRGK